MQINTAKRLQVSGKLPMVRKRKTRLNATLQIYATLKLVETSMLLIGGCRSVVWSPLKWQFAGINSCYYLSLRPKWVLTEGRLVLDILSRRLA